MLVSMELYTPGVYILSEAQCLFIPSNLMIRARKIALRGEDVFYCGTDDASTAWP